MKMSNKNKFISGLVGVAMCPMMLPTTAFATDDGAASDVSSSPTELIQSSGQPESADTGASSADAPAAQSESTGEAANTTTAKAVNEEAAPAAETGGEGTTAAVAEVKGVSYSSLQEAIDAAQDGATVTLLTDATADATIAADKNITLDLGGKTLTNTNAGKATLTIAKGATATVKNGSIVGGKSFYTIQNNGTATLEDVTATAGNTDSSMLDNWGTLTIKSGSYAGGLNVVKSEEDSVLTINGGKFELSYATSGYTGVILNYGNATINSGEFICSASYVKWAHPQCVATGLVEGHPSSTKITGGAFTNTFKDTSSNIFHGVGKATSDNFEVSGGTFNKSVPSSYFAEGLTYAKNSDGTYGVATAIAQIGTDRYTSLQAAINAVGKKAKTIQLLNDATENVTIAATKQITLDLNGHTLNGGTGTAKATILNKGNVTITDTSAGKTGTIKRDDQGVEGETSYYVIKNIGTMVIDQAIVVNNSGYKKTNPSGSMVGSSLICNGDDDPQASLTINGGTFTQPNFLVVKNGTNGTLVVNGGTLTSNHSAVQNWNKAQILGGSLTGQIWTDAWAEGSIGETVIGGNAQFTGEIVVDITGEVPPTLKIEGGSLDVTSWRVTPAAAAANATVAVSGGTFTAAVPEGYCAAGYALTANADGTYGVKQAVTVNFDSNQGTTVDSQLVAVGDKVVKPADPTKKGYTFSGWFTDEDCTKAYDFDAAVDGTDPEFTLYAGWKAAAPSTVEPGAGDNGSNGENGGNGDGSSANANVNVNTVNNNGDKAASEAKATTVKTGDNLALIGGAFALIAVAAGGIAVFALRRKKMN